jgi:hypothetical protein
MHIYSHREAMAQSPVPYTLPNGQVVNLHPLTERDYNEIDGWIKHRYMENVIESCKMLPRDEREQLMKVALEEASALTFQHGHGNRILLSSTFGVTRLAYQLIRKSTIFTFDEFHNILFPEGFLTVEGTNALSEMLAAVYRPLPSKPQEDTGKKKEDEPLTVTPSQTSTEP